MALWVLHAWTLDASTISPFLFFTSPMMRCGKSTALMLLKRSAPRPALASNISPASIFRYIERCHPSLIIDEADGFVTGNEELRCILNSGHARDTAHVIRCDGEQNEPRKFSTWAPKAVAAIGKLAATLVDRSIVISMRRRKSSEQVAKLRARDTEAFETLRRKAARWSTDNLERLREARPQIPDTLDDRQSDNWEPLLAIADLAGGDWPTKARTAALRLSADAEIDAETAKAMLLSDIRDIFAASTLDAITSKHLVAALLEDEIKPWVAYGKSQRPITERQVSSLLREFKVYPRTIRMGETTAKGYLRSSFAEAFEAYLPLGVSRSVTPSQVSDINDLEANRSVTSELHVTDRNGPNLLEINNRDGVTDRNPPMH
jgi:putative DNA primase/helicase